MFLKACRIKNQVDITNSQGRHKNATEVWNGREKLSRITKGFIKINVTIYIIKWVISLPLS